MKAKITDKKIPLFEIFTDTKDLIAVNNVLKSKRNWATGEKVDEFEKKICQYTRSQFALTFNSGTNAIYASLLAAGIGPGDEVIVPAFTYVATVEPVSLVGAKPVFVDIEQSTFGLDPKDVRKKISKKTKAIIAVHYAGIPCKISVLLKIAQENNLILIEDAAEAFGSTVGNRKVGTFGDFAIFSFSQGKIITTGEGGAVLTKSKVFFDSLKLIRSLGRKEISDTTHENLPCDFIQPGYNFRLSNILAALGVSQLSKIKSILEKRHKLAKYYQQKLINIKEISAHNSDGSGASGYHIYPVLADDRDGLSEYLGKCGIDSKVYFQPVYNHYLYRKYRDRLPTTEKISAKVLCLPFFAAMKKKDVDYVVSAIKKYYSQK